MRNIFYCFIAIIGLLLIQSNSLFAIPTFTKLYDFDDLVSGKYPYAPLLYNNGKFYGATNNGGATGGGMIYSINLDGSGFTVLRDMNSLDGVAITGKLCLIGNTLYGITEGGGTLGSGTLFRIDIDGSNFSVIRSFDLNNDGSTSEDGVVYDGMALYGVCSVGGPSGDGTLWKVNLDGSNFTVLHNFNYNSDQSSPMTKPLISSGILYGTLHGGGNPGGVYSINTDGTNFQLIHTFDGTTGMHPVGGLTEIDNQLWGTCDEGGANASGVIYKIDKDGNNYTDIHDFGSFVGDYRGPSYCQLVNSGDYIYGSGTAGGAANGGFFFLFKDGTGYNVLHDLINNEGSTPESAPILIGNILYGVVTNGGVNGNGTLYKMVLDYNLPSVSLNAATNTNSNSFDISGDLLTDGGLTVSEFGFLVGTSPNPTVQNNFTVTTFATTIGTYNTTFNNLNQGTTYYIRAYATNPFGTAYSSDIIVTTSSIPNYDSDNDGIADNIEALGPNNGDGNGDGIADNTQNYVTTIQTIKGNYVTIVSKGQTALTNVQSIESSEKSYIYPYGMLDFKVSASTATITMYFHSSNDLNNYEYRKSNLANTFSKYRNVTFGTASLVGQSVATVTIELIDGGVGDYDGLVNGIIQDPGGPAILAADINIPIFDNYSRIVLIFIMSLFGLYKFKKSVLK